MPRQDRSRRPPSRSPAADDAARDRAASSSVISSRAGFDPARAEIELDERGEQHGIVAGRLPIEILARDEHVAGGDGGSRQDGSALPILRVEPHGLPQRVERLDRSDLGLEIVVDCAESDRGLGGLPHLLQRARRAQPGLEVGRVERAEADRDVGDAGAVAARAPPGADGGQVALGVGEQALLRRDVRQQQLRRLRRRA